MNLLTFLISKKSIVKKDLSKAIEKLTIIIHPFIPHISEEIWQKMEGKELCISTKWPETKDVYENDVIKMPIQVNGKTRSLINVPSPVVATSIILLFSFLFSTTFITSKLYLFAKSRSL